MKRLVPVFLIALLFLTGCPGNNSTTEDGPVVKPIGGNVAAPATSYDLLSAFTAALPCNGVALVWSIREQGTFGWLPIDGSITQNGVWTSPGCGSVWQGKSLHIDGKCAATGQTATAVIATVPETVSGVQIAFAVRNPSGAACLYPTQPDGKNKVAFGQLCPGSTDACPDPVACYCIQAGEQIQWYAKVITTCGDVVTPTPPVTWPAVCQ